MTLSKVLITLGVITSVVTASTVGSKKLYTYIRRLKKSKDQFQDLYYDKLTQDDVAWG